MAFVTLINPPVLSVKAGDFYVGRLGGPPLNLAYLAGILEEKEVPYSVLDCVSFADGGVTPYENHKIRGPGYEIYERLIPQETSVVGFSSMFTSDWIVIHSFSKYLKQRRPHLTIVVGGEHATTDAWNIITHEPQIDFCFLGESEDSFSVFIDNLQSRNKEMEQTPGVVGRTANGKVFEQARPARLANWDHLKPSWEKFPLDFYLDNRLSYSRMGYRSLPILATRGCPYSCTFCTSQAMWGNVYSPRDPRAIVDEMKEYREKYDLEHFDFIDSAMAINKKWYLQLIDLITQEVPGVTWEMSVGTRSEILSRNVLERMYASGNVKVNYAPETGSPTFARKINKKINHGRMLDSLRAAIEIGFTTKVNFIVGIPGEEPSELWDSLKMALRVGLLGSKGVVILRFVPYQGSELAQQYPQFGHLDERTYHQTMLRHATESSADVFNLLKLFESPREQYHLFLTNTFMVLSYLLCGLRRPSTFLDSINNVMRSRPEGPVEVAAYFVTMKAMKMLKLSSVQSDEVQTQ